MRRNGKHEEWKENHKYAPSSLKDTANLARGVTKYTLNPAQENQDTTITKNHQIRKTEDDTNTEVHQDQHTQQEVTNHHHLDTNHHQDTNQKNNNQKENHTAKDHPQHHRHHQHHHNHHQIPQTLTLHQKNANTENTSNQHPIKNPMQTQ